MAHLLVVGAKSDLGRELARLFAAEGYSLYLAARNSGELAEECEHLRIRYGVQAVARELDILEYGAHAGFYESLEPKPDGVICAAGYLGDNVKAMEDFREAKRIMDTNYTGPVSILNICAADFRKRASGFIIGISSVAGERGKQSNNIYGSAKAGFSAYLSGLRNSLCKSGVRVITVKPGYMDTRMTRGMKFPPILTAQPEDAARDIVRAWKKGRDVVYTKWIWKFIMVVIIHIPEKIFKKINF